MQDGGGNVLMRIFVGEGDRHHHRPLYEALVELLWREGLAGATVLRGVSGFGARRAFHTAKLLELSADLPVIVEVIDARERIDAVLPRLEELMGGGLITLHRLDAVRLPGGTGA